MMKLNLLVLALASLMFVPALADDEVAKTKKKGKGARQDAAGATVSAQLLKQLEVVALNEQQTAKIKELGQKTDEATKKILTEANVKPELLKKRREAMASMKDSDKKGKQRTEEVNTAAGLNEAQAAAIAKVNQMRLKLKTEAIKLLTEEQKAKLPEALKNLKGEKPAGKNGAARKAKKKDAV